MSTAISAETFAQRAFDVNLVDAQSLDAAWSELGSRNVSADDFATLLVRKELLTNWQVDRLLSGERLGYFWGGYKVLYYVGHGTFARVYRAAHRETARVVALKVLRRRYCDDPEKKAEFNHEARLVMKLRHPNIVPIYEVGEERGRNFMVMEFVEGHNLREFLKLRKKFEPLEALHIIGDVCRGLDYALQQGITHRDLKLSNVLVSSQRQAKLVDFGLAALADLKIEGAHAARSIDYAGLERASGARRDDARSDIYFTGAMLYHLVSGRPPLSETRDRSKRLDVSRYRAIAHVTDHQPDLPRSLVQLIARAMHINPDRRFSTPAEMLRAINQVAARIEAGETEAWSELDEEDPASATPVALETAASDPRTVMLIESNVEMQDLLRERLKRRGYRVLVISNPQVALGRFDSDEKAADCVVVSTSEMEGAALEVFNQLAKGERTQDLPVILLAEQHHQHLVAQAELGQRRVSMSLPLKLKELLAMLEKLLEQGAQAP